MPKFQPGFTLAEMLIALTILGIVSTFTIPKILNNQADSKRESTLKEVIAAINEAGYAGYIKGEIVSGYNGSYIKDHLNAVKVCTDASVDGCFTQTATEASWERTEAGILMHNGASVAGLNDNVGTQNGVLIDWNGAALPNQAGDDQIFLEFCYTQGCANGQRPGTLQASQDPAFAQSKALFEQLFST